MIDFTETTMLAVKAAEDALPDGIRCLVIITDGDLINMGGNVESAQETASLLVTALHQLQEQGFPEFNQ